MVTEKSQSDFDNTKKAEYYDKEGFSVADKANKEKLKQPASLKELETEQN